MFPGCNRSVALASDEVAETGLNGYVVERMGYHRMKKGKKMPSIELEGQSNAQFALVDGKIVRVEQEPQVPSHSFEPKLRD